MRGKTLGGKLRKGGLGVEGTKPKVIGGGSGGRSSSNEGILKSQAGQHSFSENTGVTYLEDYREGIENYGWPGEEGLGI